MINFYCKTTQKKKLYYNVTAKKTDANGSEQENKEEKKIAQKQRKRLRGHPT